MESKESLRYFRESTSNTDRVLEILEINEAIAEVLFIPANAGQPVHLDLEEDALEQLAQWRGGTPDGFIRMLFDAVCSVPLASGPKAVFDEFAVATKRWKALKDTRLGMGLEVPPALALLACLAYAAEQMRHSEKLTAANYYQRLHESVGIESWDSKDLQKAYRKVAVDLWSSLREWLDAWEDERGQCTVIFPTEEKEGNWAIQMPISQALLREADRENLYVLFYGKGLDPGIALPDEMMRLFLGEWCLTYGTSHLAAMWKSPEYRESVLYSAQRALLSWSGPQVDGENEQSARIVSQVELTVTINNFTRRFDLGIEIRVPSHSLPDAIDIRMDDESLFRSEVQPAGPRTVRLLDRGAFDPESLISGILRVSNESINLVGMRRPRAVVPFIKSSYGGSYTERNLISLGARHGLLVKRGGPPGKENVETVVNVLEKTARAGWKILESGDLNGLPEGWVFIENVELLTFPDPNDLTPALESLLAHPVESLRFAEGFRIPGQRERWLAESPPNVLLVFPYDCEASIRVRDIHGVVVGESRSGDGVAVANVSAMSLSPGVYRVEGLSNGQVRLTSSLYLVTSATPSFAVLDQSRTMEHDLSRPYGVLAATPSGEVSDQTDRIRGLDLTNLGVGRVGAAIDEIEIPVTRPWSPANVEIHDEVLPLRRVAPSIDDPCANGAHHWMLETAGKGPAPKFVPGYCKHCLIVRRQHGRPVLKAELRGQKASTIDPSPVAERPLSPEVVKSVPAIEAREVGLWDRAFEALCYMRAGSANDLTNVAAQIAASSIAVDRLVRSLSALGHLDVSLNGRCRPAAWSISPPVLVEITERQGFLAGYRNSNLVSDIEDRVVESGGSLSRYQQESAPVAIIITVPPGVSLDEVVVGIEDSLTKTPVRIQRNASAQLLAALPPISEIILDSPESPLPAFQQIKKWDGNVATWVPVSNGLSAGAYQNIGNGYVYTFNENDLDPGDSTHVSTAAAVKHAESRLRGVPLMFYVQEHDTLCLRLGAELPGLLARAAVAYSGRLPVEDEKEHLVKYHQIDIQTARSIFQLLKN